MKIKSYKDITLYSTKKLDKKAIDHWKEMENVIKKAEEKAFRAAMCKNIDKIVMEYNKKGYIEIKSNDKPDEFMGKKIVDIEWIDDDRPKD